MNSCEDCGDPLNADTQPTEYRSYMCDDCYIAGTVCTCGYEKDADEEHCDWCADDSYIGHHADMANDERNL